MKNLQPRFNSTLLLLLNLEFGNRPITDFKQEKSPPEKGELAMVEETLLNPFNFDVSELLTNWPQHNGPLPSSSDFPELDHLAGLGIQDYGVGHLPKILQIKIDLLLFSSF